jgi:hypothetical protein
VKAPWSVVVTKEFEQWFGSLSMKEQDKVEAGVERLRQFGPQLGRPHVDTLEDSTYPNLKELRTSTNTSVLRTFFAFDPRQSAVLLCGGDKQGKKEQRWYRQMITTAERLYAEHLEQLGKDGTP